jgi:hypothetical protein
MKLSLCDTFLEFLLLRWDKAVKRFRVLSAKQGQVDSISTTASMPT